MQVKTTNQILITLVKQLKNILEQDRLLDQSHTREMIIFNHKRGRHHF